MKLLSKSLEQALAQADAAHAYLLANDAAYAASVAAGMTTSWAVPSQDGSGQWSIPVEGRCLGAFTADELVNLDEPPVEFEVFPENPVRVWA